MLPSTDIEDANVGPYRDKLRDEAEKVVSDSVEEAKNIASSTYETVKDEADRQGLSLDGKTIAQRVADVGKAAVENVESSIREKVDPDKSHT
jgi:vacuolar-type H+-ATPase subunit E/Vma4